MNGFRINGWQATCPDCGSLDVVPLVAGMATCDSCGHRDRKTRFGPAGERKGEPDAATTT